VLPDRIVNELIRFWSRQIVREMSGGVFLRPGVIALSMAAQALVLAAAEERITAHTPWGALLDRVFPPEPEAAHVVPGTIAGSMITVVSVVYSILPVVLTFASMQFSPRVLVAFVEDKVSQTTLGMFVGTFTYCLLTLPSVRSRPTPFVPSVAVILAMGLAVGCLACLLYFIHHIAVSIQASHIVDRVARETERVLDQTSSHLPYEMRGRTTTFRRCLARRAADHIAPSKVQRPTCLDRPLSSALVFKFLIQPRLCVA
jgi:uncharacterized membrane protein